MNVTVQGRTLRIDERSFDLKYPIEQAIAVKDRVIVRVDDFDAADDDPANGRNIFAVDSSGNEIWRISKPGSTDKTIDGRTLISPWTSISRAPSDGSIRAIDGWGFSYLLDPKTGKISDPIFRK